MKKPATILLAMMCVTTTNALAQVASSNPLSDGTRLTYGIMKRYITQSAAKMPEEQYSFRPTPLVRSFGEFIGHVADSNFRLCSVIAGEDPIDAGNERSRTEKAELTKALTGSFAYCDKVYDGMTDAAGTATVTFDAGVEGLRSRIAMPKLTALSFLTMANYEHYGNLVTYMRLKSIVPPSSELAAPRPAITKTGDVSKKTYSDPSGEWSLLVNTPNGPIAAVLTLSVQGTTVTGEAKFDRGVVPLTGTINSSEIKLSGKLQTLVMTFSGISGTDSMSGKVDFAGHPSGTWTAVRP
jgi:hypothetical protein